MEFIEFIDFIQLDELYELYELQELNKPTAVTLDRCGKLVDQHYLALAF
jgi:hypothetical protein